MTVTLPELSGVSLNPTQTALFGICAAMVFGWWAVTHIGKKIDRHSLAIEGSAIHIDDALCRAGEMIGAAIEDGMKSVCSELTVMDTTFNTLAVSAGVLADQSKEFVKEFAETDFIMDTDQLLPDELIEAIKDIGAPELQLSDELAAKFDLLVQAIAGRNNDPLTRPASKHDELRADVTRLRVAKDEASKEYDKLCAVRTTLRGEPSSVDEFEAANKACEKAYRDHAELVREYNKAVQALSAAC